MTTKTLRTSKQMILRNNYEEDKQMKRYKLLKLTDKRPNELLRGHLRVPVTQVSLWRMMMQGSGMGQGKH